MTILLLILICSLLLSFHLNQSETGLIQFPVCHNNATLQVLL